MTGLLAPSIISFDMTNLQDSVRTMDEAGAQILHLDVMDGQFVPPITFGADYTRSLRPHSNALFEAHLMTMTPERHFGAFAEAGCGRIIYHAETTRHAHRLAQELRDMGVSPGIAINPGTPLEPVVEVLELVDLVLVMTVNPGWGGQRMIGSALRKVSRLREIAGDELLIEVDGGIDDRTLPAARRAGANVFVVGSHLARASDLADATRELVQLCA